MALRLARQDAGFTQEELVAELKISTMSIYRWESKGKVPNAFQRSRLCAFFGKSEAELGWPGNETENAAPLGSSSRLFDPCIPLLTQRFLAGQHPLLRAMRTHFLISTSRQTVGLTGLAGSGKTAVAAALVNLPQMQQQFAGILWATVGQEPHPRQHLLRWAALLGLESLPEEAEEAHDQLRVALGNRRMLIVIDDLWEARDLLPYRIGGAECQYVVTTRQRDLAHHLCEVVYRPQVPTNAQALHLLSRALPPLLAQEHQLALRAIARQVGNLPLALEAIASYLRREASSQSSRRLQEAVARLAHPSCWLHLHLPGPDQHSLWNALARSLQELAPSEHHALTCLVQQFPSAPTSFSERRAENDLQRHGSRLRELDRLVDAGLVEIVGRSRYQLHPVVAASIRCSLQHEGPEKRSRQPGEPPLSETWTFMDSPCLPGSVPGSLTGVSLLLVEKPERQSPQA